MKRKIINLGFILVILLSVTTVFSQVGIGISPPNTSAMLDVDVSSLPTSGKKGFLPPRMDEAARDLIGTPATGLLIYNIDTNKLNYHDGSGWVVVEASAGFVSLTGAEAIDGVKTFNDMLIPKGRLMLPMGELNYFNYSAGHSMNTGTASVGASGTDDMVPIDPKSTGKTVNFVNDIFTLNGVGGLGVAELDSRLKYTSGDAGNPFVGRYFHIALSFSFSSVAGNTGETFVFGVTKNTVVEDSSKQFVSVGNAGTHQSSALHVLLWLDDGDQIGFSIGQLGGSGNVLIKSMNFVAIGM